jgi:hypothetical protein
LKIHPNRVVTHYQITELFGKAYLKLATTAIAADGIRKTGLFPWNHHIIDGHDFLEVSQRNLKSCTVESPVICTSNSEQPSTTSGTIPETLASTATQPASKNPLLFFCPLASVLFQIYLAGNKNSQQNMQHFRKGLLLF